MNPNVSSTASTNGRLTGFALVLTLIILLLASVTVIAFLTTTVTERTTAVAYGRLEKADLFVQAGVEAAIARLVTEMTYRPYHAIGYRNVAVGNFGTPPTSLTEVVPVIIGPRTTTPSTTATYNSSPGPDVYLVSTVDPVGTDPPGSTAPTGLTSSNSVDLNDNHLSTEPRGWIGSPTTSTGILPYRALWIDILRDPNQPMQPDPSVANYNPVIGRYAYWIEDETSKLDVSIIGNKDSNPAGAGAFVRGDGVDIPSNTPPKVAVNDLDLGAIPLISASPFPAGDTQNNTAIIDFRATLPMLDARLLNRVLAYANQNSITGVQLTSDVHETAKFYGTVFSLSDDLAGNGRRRVNLNALVTSPPVPPTNPAPTPIPAGVVAANIDDIAYVITGTHLIASGLGPTPPGGSRVLENAPVFQNTLTNFGARFFTPAAPTTSQKNMYLERLSANIRDYIDTDSQPTIIDAAGPTVRGVSVPAHPIETSGGGTSGPSEVVAIGKERVPVAQEYVLRVRQIAFSPRLGAFANYTISIDHYVEFWNLSNRDITLTDLGWNSDSTKDRHPFLLIANQPGWDAGGLDDIPAGASRDFKLYLKDATPLASPAPSPAQISFPAGSVTVVTTDPQPLSTQGSTTPVPTGPLTPDLTRVYYIPISPSSLRTYSGRTQRKSNSELRLNLITRTTSATDYETEIALGNDLGILESAWGAGIVGVALSVNIDNANPPENRMDDTKYHFRGGHLRGNLGTSPRATTGDPRTNAEQINFDLNGASASNDKTRYYDSGLDSGNIPGSSTLGALNSNYVGPANWPDPSNNAQTAAAAPSVISNTSLTSIGQLGGVFDPSRVPGDSGNILLSRGGGRTLKIGQPDDLAGATRFSATWFNSAWRLTDLFAARPVSNVSMPPQQSEIVAPATSRGKININGVLRDNGVAFQAALRSFTFVGAPDSDSQLNGRPLATAEADSLVASITAYLTTNGPMMERGEISQLPFFNSGTAAGGSLATANDRGREEIFRRTIEMVTTRSASFTVYAIGEAIRQDKSGNKTTIGQKRLAITFQLEPQVNGAPLQNSVTPYDVVDSYLVRKIYAPN